MPTTVRVLILRAPGTNCDRETAFAFEKAGAQADLVHINQLLKQRDLLRQYQILCIPGGFSYGDDIAAGRILASQLRYHLSEPLREFHEAGKLILGICNGFQVLIKAGLLPGGPFTDRVTLTFNDSGTFEDRWVRLEVQPGPCVFLQGLDHLELPVAHAEGKFVATDGELLNHLEQAGQVVLRYARRDEMGASQRVSESRSQQVGDSVKTSAQLADVMTFSLPYPDNPNGSWADVAGICDSSGRILGLMPHPERHIDAPQHPRWTRDQPSGAGQGLALFRNAVAYFL